MQETVPLYIGVVSALMGPQLQCDLTATAAAQVTVAPPEQIHPACYPNTLAVNAISFPQASKALSWWFNAISLTPAHGDNAAWHNIEDTNKDSCLSLLKSLHQLVSVQCTVERDSDISLLLDTLTGYTNSRAALSTTVTVISVVIQAPSSIL